MLCVGEGALQQMGLSVVLLWCSTNPLQDSTLDVGILQLHL